MRNKLAAKRKESQLLILGAIYSASINPPKKSGHTALRAKQEFPMFYNIGMKAKSLTDNLSSEYDESRGKIFVRPNSLEFLPAVSKIINNGSFKFHECVFKADGFEFAGWRVRLKIENRNFLMLENGTLVEKSEYKKEKHGPCRIFASGESIPVFNKNCIKNCVAEAVWIPISEQEFPMYYNIGRKAKSLTDNLSSEYDESLGKIFVRPNSLEFLPTVSKIINNGSFKFHGCVFKVDGFEFTGWRIRYEAENGSLYMLEDGSFVERSEYKKEQHGPCKIFAPGESIPMFDKPHIKNCVAEAVWAPVPEEPTPQEEAKADSEVKKETEIQEKSE